jgi:hypothetical protein
MIPMAQVLTAGGSVANDVAVFDFTHDEQVEPLAGVHRGYTTPSPIRRLPKLATNCTIMRNSPWSAEASGVVLGLLRTNYPRYQVRSGSIRAGELDQGAR